MKKCGVIIGILISIGFLSWIAPRPYEHSFHTPEEWETFVNERLMHAPPDTNHLFPTASRCVGCHGEDPMMRASVTVDGKDINVIDDWSTSMMANSAKDPFWRAKVSHEVLANPKHQLDLETKCTSCHAPQGHFTAILRGAQNYTIEQMKGDTIAMDGVSCGSCHSKAKEQLEHLFSGEAKYDTSKVMYGPYPQPFAAPMNDFVGFNPVFSTHINSSGVCASCHTLVTKSVDLEGNYTGNSFIEQATYHEWINSVFDDDGTEPQSCQSCHMPRIPDPVVISNNYIFLQPRAPFGLHDLIGANTTMINLIKENKEVLNIDAADKHFEETIEKTLLMLQKNTVDLDLTMEDVSKDTAYISVKLTNKSGHKFPTGYPSRRVFVETIMETDEGDTLFHSGKQDENFQILNDGETHQPHYDIISKKDQVQVYEFIIADVNGTPTNLLERADIALKDNRIPPKGFSSNHSVYDTTQIIGRAIEDQNFNKENHSEGSGTDLIHYHIPLEGYSGLVNIRVNIFYQAIAPRWISPMFDFNSEEINSFKSMYNNADLSPVKVAQDSMIDYFIASVSTIDEPEVEITIYPSPSTNGYITVDSPANINQIDIYTEYGHLIKSISSPDQQIELPLQKGLLFLHIYSNKGIIYKKIVHL